MWYNLNSPNSRQRWQSPARTAKAFYRFEGL
jgi:hypothetical protein